MFEIGNTLLGQGSMQALAWALVHFLWQGALVAIMLRCFLAWIPQQLATWRYGVSLVALVAMALLPVGTAWYGLTSTQLASIEAPDGAPQGGGAAWSAVSDGPAENRLDAADHVLPAEAGVALPGAESAWASGSLRSMLRSMQLQLQPHLAWVLRLWLLGVALFGLQQVLAWRHLRRLVHRGVEAEGELQTLLSGLVDRLGIRQRVTLLSSHDLSVPTVIGALKPVILVPMGTLTRMSREDLEMILAHELAHIRRHDYAVNLLQSVIETLLFYHPAVWWVSGQVRQEREHCCDDSAVDLWGDSRGYARALLNLEESRPNPALALAASGTPLLGRVRRLLGAGDSKPGLASTAVSGVLSLSILAAVMLLTFPVHGDGVGVRLFGSVAAPPAPVAPIPTAPVAPPSPPPSPAVQAPAVPGRPAPAPRPPVAVAQIASVSGPSVVAAAPMFTAVGSFGKPDHDLALTGRFEMDRTKEGEYWLRLRGEGRSYQVSFTLSPSAISDASWTSPGKATVRRQAGALHLTGQFSGQGQGIGTFRFAADAAFRQEMRRRGYGEMSANRQFELALHDVSTAYIDELASLGYEDVALERLIELRIHDVDGAFMRSFRDVGFEGLDLKDWLAFSIHDISPQFIEAMGAAGFADLAAERWVEMSIHDVDPAFVAEMQGLGFEGLTVARLIELSIHDVSAEYAEAMAAAGYSNLPVERLIEFSIHDVDPDFVAAMAAAGYTDLPPEQLVEMSIHDVGADFIAALSEAGYRDIPVERLIEMSIHDVDARRIEALAEAGYYQVPADQLIAMSIHDVDPAFINAMAEVGYSDLPTERLVEFRIHGVSPRFVRQLEAKGYRNLSPGQLVEKKILGID